VQGGGESHVCLPIPSGLVSPCTLGGRDRNLPIRRTPLWASLPPLYLCAEPALREFVHMY
jgi:hypothetical protein